jgi:formamidopyrimidine-DNA glycosylase
MLRKIISSSLNSPPLNFRVLRVFRGDFLLLSVPPRLCGYSTNPFAPERSCGRICYIEKSEKQRELDVPELPEVETMRRGILALVGNRIRGAVAEPCDRRPILLSPDIAQFSKRVAGRTVTAVDRLGKRVVVRLDSGDAIIFEPRMTGLVLVADPPSVEHLRFRLDLKDGPIRSVWYWDRRGLGSVRLMSSDEITIKLGNGALGVDALAVSPEELQAAFGSSRRAIKVALLDQRALAGVGNLYASEILHRAKVHPETPCAALKPQQWRLVHLYMREVLEEAIRHEGSTLSDGTYRNALNQNGGYQNCHLVYDREGEPCRTCSRGTIRRIVQAQRSTFYCGVCQREKRIRAKRSSTCPHGGNG